MTDFVGYIIFKVMKITTQGEYGLRCMLRIAEAKGEPLTIEEICDKEHLSCDYAEQLLLRLRRAGLIRSQKGPGGGYLLSKRPGEIRVSDVVMVLEKNPFEVFCSKFKKKKLNCVNNNGCKIKGLWKKIEKASENILSKVRIADLI